MPFLVAFVCKREKGREGHRKRRERERGAQEEERREERERKGRGKGRSERGKGKGKVERLLIAFAGFRTMWCTRIVDPSRRRLPLPRPRAQRWVHPEPATLNRHFIEGTQKSYSSFISNGLTSGALWL